MRESEARKLVYGSLYTRAGELLDICLCTVSRAPNSYTLSNNSARMEETLAEAIAVDENLIRAWQRHPNLHIIESEEFVKDKIDKVLLGIATELGIHESVTCEL